MAEFFSFLKVFVGCCAVLLMVMLALLALPQSRLRCVGLEIAKWAMAGGLVLLVASPVDLIPDVVPALGFADDIGYVIGAFAAARGAWGERRKRLLYEEIELQDLQQQAGVQDNYDD